MREQVERPSETTKTRVERLRGRRRIFTRPRDQLADDVVETPVDQSAHELSVNLREGHGKARAHSLDVCGPHNHVQTSIEAPSSARLA